MNDVESKSLIRQLEKRAEEHRARVTALEEEKSRIDQIIRDIQGVIPHYEALIAAERALDRSVKATDGVPTAS